MPHSSPTSEKNIILGLIFAIIAALGFSAKAIFVKLAYQYPIDAITLLMFRMIFALPLFFIIAYLEEKKASKRISHQHILLIILMGLIGYYLSSLLDFIGLMYISAGLERLILFIYPTLVVVLSALFFGQRIQKEAYIALALSYAGIALAMFHDIQFSSANVILGSVLVFAATLTYSIFLVGSGELIPKVGAKRFAAYAMIVSCIAVLIQFAIMRDSSDFIQPIPVYIYGLAMAVFSTVLPAILLAMAIEYIGASKTSIIGALGPVATIIMASIFLDEIISLMQLLGAALVILGVYILGKK